jgi:hypothetical protein
MEVEPTVDAIERALAELGVSLPADELEELAGALPALRAWIGVAEGLAGDEPAFVGPLPERW